MAQYFSVHPQNPQPRLLKQAAALLRQGGLLAIPTDSSYAVVAALDDKAAADAIRRLRGVDERHHLTLLVGDLADIGQLARVDNQQYRLLKAATPGPFTFILQATREVPRRLSHPSRKTIGLRMPDHPVVAGLYAETGPLLSASFIPADETEPLNDPQEIRNRFEHALAGIIEAGPCPTRYTTVVDLSGDEPELIREGRGDPALLGIRV
ncbi:threonylcarbamoyl-AMP synthase [Achromobacter sp. GG226]|uniref:L-threonylcarbamoyladenylate synthase n=1 Tax=Verticiella alkaliphila TaxID=2779529 RepID=UPI001C0E8364|nr:L-threonylcarbamoyladenylate synthase [Verticiella sp. GG226]MBU4612559.1 threonylcarbamoyl-AMP synthase [Verticiella sp. GG226]